MFFINIVYLLEHISEQLHTLVRHFTNNNNKFYTVCKNADLIDGFEKNNLIIDELNHCNTIPKIIINDQNICYCIVYKKTEKFLIGPLRIDEIHTNYILLNDDLYVCSIDKLLSFILLLHNCVNEYKLTKNEILEYNFPVNELDNLIQEKFVLTLFENIENSKKHNSHYKEVRELNSIKNGDLNSLMKSWEEDLGGDYGQLAKDNLRQAKNLAISTLILASRAAISGGLHHEISYTMVDKYIYELEEIKNVNKIIPLMRKAEIKYTQLVNDLKKIKKNIDFNHPTVEKTKDYILRNIYSPLTIKSIAKDLEVNGNYLAEIFKKQENISIPKYIMKEKINLSKHMLIYSNSTYIVIATNLGFSSQSYFTQKFRESTGLTPKKFRDLYGVTNIIY